MYQSTTTTIIIVITSQPTTQQQVCSLTTYQKMIEYIKEDRQLEVFLISYFFCVHTKNNTLSKEIMNKTLRKN
jgi:hypothetical protein